MGYCCLLEEPKPQPAGAVKALMIAACCQFCKDVPGDGEQNLATEVNLTDQTVSVTDGTTTKLYTFDQLL